LALYTGPEFILHYRYANILNIFFIAMFFGVGMPILFPIALLDLFCVYVVERFYLSIFYQQPPQMDEKMTV